MFRYQGVDYVFCGFYEDKFAFYSSQGKMIFIKSIDEITNYAQS